MRGKRAGLHAKYKAGGKAPTQADPEEGKRAHEAAVRAPEDKAERLEGRIYPGIFTVMPLGNASSGSKLATFQIPYDRWKSTEQDPPCGNALGKGDLREHGWARVLTCARNDISGGRDNSDRAVAQGGLCPLDEQAPAQERLQQPYIIRTTGFAACRAAESLIHARRQREIPVGLDVEYDRASTRRAVMEVVAQREEDGRGALAVTRPGKSRSAPVCSVVGDGAEDLARLTFEVGLALDGTLGRGADGAEIDQLVIAMFVNHGHDYLLHVVADICDDMKDIAMLRETSIL